MADIVNLNRARKKKAAAAKVKTAEENRTKFGRTKGQKAREEMEQARRKLDLDGSELDN
ncbi:MAG: DUF4169 family protein [Pseudomonadota bacterium]